MDRSYVVWAYWMIALIAGVGIIAWGYRADRKSVLFSWNRYWHWWRVSIIYGSIAAASVIPVGWLIYWSTPPSWLFVVTVVFFPIFVFAMGIFHWRLWVPIFGTGLALRTYARETVLTFGYSLGLALLGGVVVFVVGRVISG